MPRSSVKDPKYCLHKPSGQACVYEPGTGAIRYLGLHGSEESLVRYRQFLAELQESRSAREAGIALAPSGAPQTIAETLLAYRAFAKTYYVGPDGLPNKEFVELGLALKPLRELFGNLPAAEFGPKKLKTLRQYLIDEQQLSRGVVNARINRVRRFFKWAVAEELIPPSVFEGLRAVDGLRRGRTTAREANGVAPVPVEYVQLTLPYLSPQVRAMVQIQLLGGMRPSEATRMRVDEIDMSGEVWIYSPSDHKNRWRGRDRNIPLGPQAQEILAPFLPRGENPYLFSPAEAEAWRHEQRATERNPERKTKIYPSELRTRELRRAASVKRKAKRPKRTRYDVDSYRRAIEYAIRRLNADREKQKLPAIPKWFPLQLRHTRATDIRKIFGLEGAQVALGHAHAAVTEIYAERDLAKAVEIARQMG